jgi:hypothetical protein
MAGEAAAKGWPTVPSTAYVHDGNVEINTSRDLAAQTDNKIPTSAASWRSKSGISSGTAAPSGGADGDIYFKIIG